ncbi:MAG TPA: ATP-binding protein, partial [Alphaproteobacteria bacterium]|nr:ATP-binding protein [Alphaproteobacteria bacterium]
MLSPPRKKTYFALLCLALAAVLFFIFYSIHTFTRPFEEYDMWTFITLEAFAFFMLSLCGFSLFKLRRANMRHEYSMNLLKSRMAAIEAAGDGIGILDRQGNLTYANEALWNIYGIPKEKRPRFLNRYWGELYTEKGRTMIAKTVMPHMALHKTWSGTSPIMRHDGKVAMAELSLRMLDDGSMVGTTRDVSEKYRAESERKELERQFFQAQKMEAVGRLAGGVAHDFNNILAAVNGYAEFLSEDLIEGTRQRNYALNILKATQQARKVVDQILTFSRQKQSGMDKVNMLEPLQEASSLLEATLPKTIQVETRINVPLTTIDGNEAQVTQAIMNLCLNAHDAIDEVMEGHGKIIISLINLAGYDVTPSSLRADDLLDARQTPPISVDDMGQGRTRLCIGKVSCAHDYICLEISDTGAGMERTVMEHIFEPFFTTKPVDKGTGLGLATVHGIVASHQGAMVVESAPGQGSKFKLYFPLSETLEEAHKTAAQPSSKSLQGTGHIL